jgi:hypothetical protein
MFLLQEKESQRDAHAWEWMEFGRKSPDEGFWARVVLDPHNNEYLVASCVALMEGRSLLLTTPTTTSAAPCPFDNAKLKIQRSGFGSSRSMESCAAHCDVYEL